MKSNARIVTGGSPSYSEMTGLDLLNIVRCAEKNSATQRHTRKLTLMHSSNRFAGVMEHRDTFDGGDSINVLELVKGEERYVFFFDDSNYDETLRQLGRFASNPDLSFTWYDACVMSQRVREAVERA